MKTSIVLSGLMSMALFGCGGAPENPAEAGSLEETNQKTKQSASNVAWKPVSRWHTDTNGGPFFMTLWEGINPGADIFWKTEAAGPADSLTATIQDQSSTGFADVFSPAIAWPRPRTGETPGWLKPGATALLL